MYIIVEHEISNPKTFWEDAKSGLADLPSNLKLHQSLPNREGTKAVCLWEAASVNEVREFVEGAVGAVSNNAYFAVEAGNAMGLPNALKAAVTA
ncbi:MAG TPA: hypothetical protein VFG32_13495 [Bacteroidota bacterium]|nr:hypothetical protein [Bacteroidota bacterium]